MEDQMASAIQAARDAGTQYGKPFEAGGKTLVLVPPGSALSEIDGEALLSNPRRKKANVVAEDASGFIEYFNLFCDEHSMIFAQRSTLTFAAILDYHHSGSGEDSPARWGVHRLTYKCPISKEWETWFGMNAKKFGQVAFATFLEDNIDDVVDPAGVTLLQIAKTLEAKKSAQFSSEIRLDNGQVRFNYTQEIRGSASNGELEIPEIFAIGIPVLYGGKPYKIRARLRYRIDNEGHLEFFYNLMNPHRIVEDAFQSAFADIAEKTKAKIIRGTP